MRFTFEVPGKPVPQGSTRCYNNRVVYDNRKELRVWRASITLHAMSQCPKHWDSSGPMTVEAVFHMPRPAGHYGAKGLKPSAPWWPTFRPGDIDKTTRALLDSLTDAGVWGDDSQVVQLAAEKRYDDDGPGRLTCTVTRLTERRGTE